MEKLTVPDLLAQAKAAGLKIRVEDGGLVVRGPRRAEAIAREVLARQQEVMALLAPACPVCGGALRIKETDSYVYQQCSASPIDYFKVTNKRPGEPMGLFTTKRTGDECRDCRVIATTYNGRCADCLTRWCAGAINGQAEEVE